eukprot:8946100-Alexandrium_andersonii.AAC.1
MGDCNAKVSFDGECIGEFSSDTVDANGLHLMSLLRSLGLCAVNTWLAPPGDRFTCQAFGRKSQ